MNAFFRFCHHRELHGAGAPINAIQLSLKTLYGGQRCCPPSSYKVGKKNTCPTLYGFILNLMAFVGQGTHAVVLRLNLQSI